ncbi:hypothetical protein DCS_08267 [Drechmeria coniospora]|uniref:Uncharacterized protein n=1 Tax=Drechmeria coniospora TaxID=98403 RepID=A0A151GGR1_DRECN|nr:hypothetical protein DCS_08267 [Drechmeria coniospora]KYK56297.1 hypothetical protein DCS_08267 [Drechmeria coniospora]
MSEWGLSTRVVALCIIEEFAGFLFRSFLHLLVGCIHYNTFPKLPEILTFSLFELHKSPVKLSSSIMKFINAVFFATIASAASFRRQQNPAGVLLNIQNSVINLNSNVRFMSDTVVSSTYPEILDESFTDLHQVIQAATSYFDTMPHRITKEETSTILPFITKFDQYAQHVGSALTDRIWAIFKSESCNSVQSQLRIIQNDFKGLGKVLSQKIDEHTIAVPLGYTKDVTNILENVIKEFAPDACKAGADKISQDKHRKAGSKASGKFSAWRDN